MTFRIFLTPMNFDNSQYKPSQQIIAMKIRENLALV